MSKINRVPDLVVTRHQGAVEWIASRLPDPTHVPPVSGRVLGAPFWAVQNGRIEAMIPVHDESRGEDVSVPTGEAIPVKAEVTFHDVWRKNVVGILPPHLIAPTASYYAVEFAGPPPRGAEYGPGEMDAAGARLTRYAVLTEVEILYLHELMKALVAFEPSIRAGIFNKTV